MDAVQLRLTEETRSGDHGEAGNKAVQLLLRGADQQLMDEQVLAGQLVHHPDGQPVGGIGSGKAVKNEKLPTLEVGAGLSQNGVEAFRGNGDVHLAPVDILMDFGLVHHKAVVGRTTGVFAGFHHQRAALAQLAFAARQSLFHQPGGFQIAIYLLGGNDTQRFQILLH